MATSSWQSLTFQAEILLVCHSVNKWIIPRPHLVLGLENSNKFQSTAVKRLAVKAKMTPRFTDKFKLKLQSLNWKTEQTNIEAILTIYELNKDAKKLEKSVYFAKLLLLKI